MKAVKVVWHDAHDQSETWIDPSDIDSEPYAVTSVGFLIPDRKPAHVVIAQSASADGSLDNVLAIPLGMVQTIEELFGGNA